VKHPTKLHNVLINFNHQNAMQNSRFSSSSRGPYLACN